MCRCDPCGGRRCSGGGPPRVAKLVTEKIRSHPNITVVPGEVTDIPEGEVIIASGPLTSDALAEKLQTLLGANSDLHFLMRRRRWCLPKVWI